ncbi:MAG TPA: tetratricopeptide repeat protein [Verrucomicrobiae bacterium]|jgi:tetratricopeptide (TPR) repeat protein|nr:tetratricopeptide repeat protein [Verrucomicrobiae bacterium]
MTSKNSMPAVLVCLVLALGTLFLYAPAFHFDFAPYVDPVYVTANPHVSHGLSGSELGWYFQAGYAGNWHPLTWISHALDCQVFGLKPSGPHVVNVLLHIVNSLLVFFVLRQITGAFWRAAAVAALFAWHPLQVETVAWISERKDLLAALFFLLTLLAYARYVRGAKIGYALALACFALGLMSKPVLVTLPCILLLLDFWPLGRAQTPENKFDPRRLAPLLIEKIPFFALSAASCVITIMAEEANPISTITYHLHGRIVNAEMSYWRYLQHAFWPSDLGAVYPTVYRAPLATAACIGLILAGLTVIAVAQFRKRPYWTVGWLWFAGMLVPVTNIVHGGAQNGVDHAMYLPVLGLFVLVCWEASDLASHWPKPQAVLGGVGALVLIGCLTASSQQLPIWRNEATLVARIPQPNSNFAGHITYAAYLLRVGQLPEAEAECQKGIAIAPNNAGFIGLLAEIQRKAGRLDDAAKNLRAALDVNPELPAAHMLLGQILLQQNQPAAALGQFDLLLQFTPKDPEAHWWRGNALSANQDPVGAINEFSEALKLDPKFAAAMNDLAWILATDTRSKIHDPANAIRLAERACEISRNTQPRMLGTLAASYAAGGRFDDAVAAAQKAHDVAAAQGDKALANQNLQLQQLYREHQPYRE